MAINRIAKRLCFSALALTVAATPLFAGVVVTKKHKIAVNVIAVPGMMRFAALVFAVRIYFAQQAVVQTENTMHQRLLWFQNLE